MLRVGNKQIQESILEILQTLLNELNIKGINYLRVLKQNGNNIQTCCPYHKNGQEKKPSCGISTVDTPQTQAGTLHCFTCGMVATLPQLISHCFGFNDGGVYGDGWLLDNFYGRATNNRESIIMNALKKLTPTTTSSINYVTEEELDTYRYTHPYMYKRRLNDEVIEAFDVGFDKFTNCITFPCNDINGNCLFVARRSVYNKFFHYPTGVDKPVYALDKIKKGINQIVVCEGIIDALTLWTYNIPAVALLGLGTKKQYEILNNFNTRKYVLAFDGDSAGRNAILRFKKNVKSKLVEYFIMPNDKDINDLKYEEFINLKKGI